MEINSLNDNCIFNAIKQDYLQNKKQCKISHINVNSIRHKFEPFREILQEHILDVLTIQETKIDNSFQKIISLLYPCTGYTDRTSKILKVV